MTASVDDRVGRGVAEYTGGAVGLGGGGGVLVGSSGTGSLVLVGCGSGGFVVLVAGPIVGLIQGVAVGGFVGSGSCGGVVLTGCWAVGVGVRCKAGVAVFLAWLVGVLSPGIPPAGVEVEGKDPVQGSVGVGVGLYGVTSAIPPGLPVSGGRLTPSKSWMISSPITGTETGISSTP